MQQFNPAIETIQKNIEDYKKKCLDSNKKVLSNTGAFFRNLIPFGRHYGGQSGYERAEKFIQDMNEQISKKSIQNTKQLLSFAANYSVGGSYLRKKIWKSIREAAGFKQKHMDLLIDAYQDRYEGKYGPPSVSETQLEMENLCNKAISGYYSKELIDCIDIALNGNFDPNSKSYHKNDYGKTLLNNLEIIISRKKTMQQRNIPDIELDIMPSNISKNY